MLRFQNKICRFSDPTLPRTYPLARLKIHTRQLVLLFFLCGALCGSRELKAQELRPHKAPTVTMVEPGITSVVRGKSAKVDLLFRVSPGFHVNSNKPHSEFLIPTVLRLTAPTDIVIGVVNYPPGQESSFPFAPDDKLSVYGSQFSIDFAVRPLASVLPTKYAVHGQLKYQACDDATCYPPKVLPVTFLVKVLRSNSQSSGPNPAQSPHAHR
jgi:hypothetical protein